MRWRRIWAVTVRHLLEVKHTPSRSNDLLVWPVIDTLLFGSLGTFLSKAATGSVSVTFVLSGLFLYHVVYQSSVALSMGFMHETGARNVLNLMTTPLRMVDYMAGLMVFGLLRMCVGLAVIVVMAKLLFGYNVFTGGVGLIPIVLLLAVVGTSMSFFLIGLQVRLGRPTEQVTWALAVLVPTISGAFYPIDALPGFLQPISRLLPTTHAFSAARSLVAGNSLPCNDVAITALGALVMLIGGTVFLRRMVRSFCNNGLVTRYS